MTKGGISPKAPRTIEMLKVKWVCPEPPFILTKALPCTTREEMAELTRDGWCIAYGELQIIMKIGWMLGSNFFYLPKLLFIIFYQFMILKEMSTPIWTMVTSYSSIPNKGEIISVFYIFLPPLYLLEIDIYNNLNYFRILNSRKELS